MWPLTLQAVPELPLGEHLLHHKVGNEFSKLTERSRLSGWDRGLGAVFTAPDRSCPVDAQGPVLRPPPHSFRAPVMMPVVPLAAGRALQHVTARWGLSLMTFQQVPEGSLLGPVGCPGGCCTYPTRLCSSFLSLLVFITDKLSLHRTLQLKPPGLLTCWNIPLPEHQPTPLDPCLMQTQITLKRSRKGKKVPE